MTVKTAIQYCVLVNGTICLEEDGTPFRAYDFKKAKEFRIEMSYMFVGARVEVARITVIEGV